MNLAYLSFGANIDPTITIPAALALLTERVHLLAVSTIWESEPLGATGQPNFLNGAALIKTGLSPTVLKGDVLSGIETRLGRVRTADKNAPRPIDLDLILFNRAVFDLAGRPIPSPELLIYPFVALPLAEVAPHYVHPQTGQTLEQIAQTMRSPIRLWPRHDLSILTIQGDSS